MNPTTLEKALKSYAIWKNGLVVQPTVGTHFDSMAEAFEFYNLYSWQIGFGIRYDRSRWNSQRTKTIQDIVCGCAVSFLFHFVFTYVDFCQEYYILLNCTVVTMFFELYNVWIFNLQVLKQSSWVQELSNVSNLRCRTPKSGGPSMSTSIWITRSRSSLFSWCAVRSS